jgi:hypothetical protein
MAEEYYASVLPDGSYDGEQPSADFAPVEDATDAAPKPAEPVAPAKQPTRQVGGTAITAPPTVQGKAIIMAEPASPPSPPPPALKPAYKKWTLLIPVILASLWALAGIAAFITSLLCFGRTGTFGDKVLGLILSIFFGPIYWIYFWANREYCRAMMV